MKVLWELFSMFFRIGAFTFGGGYAMLPIIQEEVVDNKGWLTEDEILDCFAIGQSTPGVIAVNTATFIGYKRKGIIGGLVATMGVVLPSIVIISIIGRFFTHFQEYELVQHALGGIRVAVVALILNTVAKMYKKAIKDWLGIGLFIAAFILIAFIDISPVIVIIIAALVGIFRGQNTKLKETDRR